MLFNNKEGPRLKLCVEVVNSVRVSSGAAVSLQSTDNLSQMYPASHWD